MLYIAVWPDQSQSDPVSRKEAREIKRQEPEVTLHPYTQFEDSTYRIQYAHACGYTD